jgi:hypothetical protein
MIRIRPVRVEDAEGVIRVLNPLIQSGNHTVLDRILTIDEDAVLSAAFRNEASSRLRNRILVA